MDDFEKKQREQGAKLARAAWSGAAPWLEEAILSAGYVRGDFPAVRARQLAAIFGITEQGVGAWHHRDKMPRNQDGTYDLAAVVQWRLKQSKGSSRDLHVERARRESAAADKLQIEVAQLAGKLVMVDDAIKAWQDMAAAMKARLRSIPAKMAPQISNVSDKSECFQLLMESIDEALNELSSYTPGSAGETVPVEGSAQQPGEGEGGSVQDTDPAPKPQRKRVGRRKPKAEPGE